MAPPHSESRHSAAKRHALTKEQPDPNQYTWVQSTVIEDDDLQFGGKPLSEWYEEDRSRLSSGSSDDGGQERRGRERTRRSQERRHKKA